MGCRCQNLCKAAINAQTRPELAVPHLMPRVILEDVVQALGQRRVALMCGLQVASEQHRQGVQGQRRQRQVEHDAEVDDQDQLQPNTQMLLRVTYCSGPQLSLQLVMLCASMLTVQC